MTDINTLFPAKSPLFALEALEINAWGMITGYALQMSTGQVHAFLATPITDDVAEAATPTIGSESSSRPTTTPQENVRNLSQRACLGGAKAALVAPQ
jgi:hypothetical protein